MTRYELVQEQLRLEPRRWLITGVAGFIGSNILEKLLSLGQHVVGLDNFATGYQRNLDEVLRLVGPEAAARFRMIEGDIRDQPTCRAACVGVDVVLHQAALGSVPRSVRDPLTTNAVNADGFLNVLIAARDARIERLVYASSSAVYGDHPALPKVESEVGRPLSPYAITKKMNELYGSVFADLYGMEIVGLRYFNVFGPRQDPNGAYAALIPRWVGQLLKGETCLINGDGETSRDFCYVENVIQANILAATVSPEFGATNQVYNVAVGDRTTLNEMFRHLRDRLVRVVPDLARAAPEHRPFREGDIRHSLASIDRAAKQLGYIPEFTVSRGLDESLGWYIDQRGHWTTRDITASADPKRQVA